MSAPVLPCVCGKPLDDAKSEGVWTLAEIACEYRTCLFCHSTRAFAPVDKLRGRRVDLYLDPDTSEITESWSSFLDALEAPPPNEVAELRRNGVLLARVYRGIDGVHGWVIQKPEHEIALSV